MATLTHKLTVFSDGTVSITSSSSLQRFKVKRDQFTVRWNFQVRDSAPAPAVFRTGEILDSGSFDRTPFTKEWQLFAADLLALKAFGKGLSSLTETQKDYIKQRFTSLYASNRAFNNGAGVDEYANFVTGQRLTMSLPKIDPLICSDDIVYGTKVVNSKGITMVRLHSFDATQLPPAPSLTDSRVLIAYIINNDGTLQNFPQLREYKMSVPYIYISSAPVYFPLYDLVEL